MQVLSDLDFNYNRLKKVAIEPLSALVTGLNSQYAGTTIHYDKKLWCWDGAAWQTWDAPYWSNQAISLGIGSPPVEATALNLVVTNISDSKYAHYITYEFDDARTATLGTLSLIGTTVTTPDFTTWRGKRCVITTKNNCWFNIKNLATTSSYYKAIETGTGADISYVTKAEFVYRESTATWVLVSYITLKPTDTVLFQNTTYSNATIANIGNLDVTSLTDANYNVHFVQLNYATYTFASLGSLDSIGTSSTENLAAYKGKKIIVTAKDGCFFTITDQMSSPPTNYRKIETGHYFIQSTNGSTPIQEVVKAVFVWDQTRLAWMLESYETLKNWFVTMSIGDSGNTTSSSPLTINTVGTTQFPIDGYYHVDVFVDVIEWTTSGFTTQNVTTNEQKLEVIATNGTTLTFMRSGRGTNFYNTTLQGSAIMYVARDVANNRNISLKVYLPNGLGRRVYGGRIHATWLGTNVGRSIGIIV